MGSDGEGGDVEELIKQLKNPPGGFHFFLSHKQSPSYVRDADGNKTDEILAPSAADALGNLLGELRGRYAWVKCWYAPEFGEVELPTMMEAVQNCENFLLFLTKKIMLSWYVQKEVKRAINIGKNIVIVHHETECGGGAHELYNRRHEEDFFGFNQRFGEQTDGWQTLNDEDVRMLQAKEAIAWGRLKEHAHTTVAMILKTSKLSTSSSKNLHAHAMKTKAIYDREDVRGESEGIENP